MSETPIAWFLHGAAVAPPVPRPPHKLGRWCSTWAWCAGRARHRALADAEMAAALLARMQHDLTTQWQLPSADFAQLQADAALHAQNPGAMAGPAGPQRPGRQRGEGKPRCNGGHAANVAAI